MNHQEGTTKEEAEAPLKAVEAMKEEVVETSKGVDMNTENIVVVLMVNQEEVIAEEAVMDQES